MAPTVSAAMVSPPAPATPHDSTKIIVRQFRKEDLSQVIQLFKEGMLNYPKSKQDPRLHEYIDNIVKTDLGDIEATYYVVLVMHINVWHYALNGSPG
ncbi:unnamed protein product [Phytophthora fragariaefolia]|uniref:Unnamed protein product n=1 Tax=Phytophthora fragariaefolia TaxID=1490495 RepID=A0A9W6XNN8_9STRA|nr:unnamed protein product [Phytophthora fragariaefolia]